MSILTNLLEAAGADYRVTSQSAEVTMCCPFCEERGFQADTKYHLGLNTDNGKAHCFKCDWKSGNGVFTARQLRRVYRIEFDFRERELEEPEPKKKKKDRVKPIALPEEFEPLRGKLDSVGRAARRYLESRQVSVFQMVRHDVHFAAVGKYGYRVIFPVLDADRDVYGYVARAFEKGQTPPYLNSPGLKMLWGTHIEASRAVVVEGIMDALSVERAVMRMPGTAAVARLGSTITDIQIDQLKAYESVIIFPDFDRAGLKGAEKLGERCADSGISNVSVVIPDEVDGSDPGGMSDEDIVAQIHRARPWSSGSRYRLRAAAARQTTDL